MSTINIKDLIDEAKSYALEIAKNKLVTSESLDDVPGMITTVSRDIATLESQIKAIASAQIEEAKVAMEKLKVTETKIATLKKMLADKCKESRELIDNYKLIKVTSITAANVRKTRDWLQRMRDQKKEIDEIEEMLADEHHEELLEAYERICQLEDFRYDCLSHTKVHPELRNVFANYLTFIDHIGEKFNAIIKDALRDIVELAQRDICKLVRVIRIIEREEKRTMKRQEAKRYHHIEDVDSNKAKKGNFAKLTNFSEFRKSLEVQGKQYKIWLYEGIRNCTKNRFQEELRAATSIDEKLKRFSDIVKTDLEIIQNEVVECFPPEYNIMEFYVTEYSSQISNFIKKYVEDLKHLPHGDLLYLAEWIIHDYKKLFQEYEKYNKQAINLLEKEYLPKLIEEYKQNSYEFLSDSIVRIIDREFEPDANLDEILQEGQDGFPYTTSPIDYFVQINNCVEAVIKARIPELFYKIVLMVRGRLVWYKDYLLSKLENTQELQLVLLCAMTNNMLRCINNAEELEERIMEHIPEKISEKETKDNYTFKEVISGFESIGHKFIQIIAAIINRDIFKLFDVIGSKQWLERSTMSDIAATLIDYFEDTKICLHTQWYNELREIICGVMVGKYLDILITKQNLKLNEQALKTIGEDISLLKKVFNERSLAWTIKHLEVVYQFLMNLQMEPIGICLATMLYTFPDVPIEVPTLLVGRSTLGDDSRKKKEIIQQIENYYKNSVDPEDVENAEKSLFEKYRTQLSKNEKSASTPRLKDLIIQNPTKTPSNQEQNVEMETESEDDQEVEVIKFDDLFGL